MSCSLPISSRPSGGPCRGKAGFTLMELLIGLAIIAVLAVFLTAGVSKVRKMSASVGDVGNLRQIHMATEAFCQDHPNQHRIFFGYDRYTGAANRYGYGPMVWMRLLRPYFGEQRLTYTPEVKAYISPGDPSHGMEIDFYKQEAAKWGRRSYSFNIQTLDPNLSAPDLPRTNSRKRVDIPNPSRFMILCNHRATYLDTNWIDPTNATSTGALPTDWFGNGTAHFLFLDGHVESIPVKEVLPGGSRHSIFYP